MKTVTRKKRRVQGKDGRNTKYKKKKRRTEGEKQKSTNIKEPNEEEWE